jgi:hypothetical protein
MTRNKILSAAIASALSMGGGLAQALDDPSTGTFVLTAVDGDTTTAAQTGNLEDATVLATPAVAMELFQDGMEAQILPDPVPAGATNPAAGGANFVTRYELDATDAIEKTFYVTYTLSGDAQWAKNLSVGAVADADELAANYIVGSHFNLVRDTNNTVFILDSSGTTDDNVAKFVVRAGDTVLGIDKEDNDAALVFAFQIDNLTALQTAGASVTLKIELANVDGSALPNANASKTITLVESKAGGTILIKENAETDVRIDVGEGGTKFAGSDAGGPQSASLGTISVANAGNVMMYDLTTSWTFAGDTTTGSLILSNAPLAASQTHDPSATTPINLVYIDNNGDCDDEDIVAATVDDATTANWTDTQLTDTVLGTDMIAATVAAVAANDLSLLPTICVKVPDGNTVQINQTSEAPEAVLKISYFKHKDVLYKGTLRYIKRNGAVCTLYNVPDEGQGDKINIRITNPGSGSGTLSANLRDDNNNLILTNQLLNDGNNITANQTVVLNSAKLVELAQAAGHSGVWGRGILTITSTLSEMKVLGLLRQRTASIGTSTPLMPMSSGASGNGCD